MGSHTWEAQCPYCDFEEMLVSSYDSIHFETSCPICGYEMWTEEKVPDNEDLEFAKHRLLEMDTKEKNKAVELYNEDNIPLVIRLKMK